MQSYKPDLGDFIDMETMQFVSPYEINPIVIDDIRPSEAAATVTQQVSPDQNSLVLQKRDISQTALKMEEFSDLSGLLLGPNVDIIDSVDELNTPVIDKEEFDFATHQPSAIKVNEKKTDLKVKVEYNAQYYSCDKHIYTGLDLAPDNHVQIRGNYSISKVGSEQNDVYLYPPNVHSISFKEKTNDACDAYISSNQGLNILDKMAAFNCTFDNLVVNSNIKNSNSTTTSPQEDRYSYISSPGEDQNMENSVPDYYDHLYDAKPRLSLITEQIKFPVKQEDFGSLNTPDVIEDVVSMGSDFNILDLVNNEDITIINADEELLKSLTSPSILSSEPSTPSTTVSKQTPTKKSRRRKLSDDDGDEDEDYVPPSKKKLSTVRLSDIDVEHSNSSDDSDYHPRKPARKQNSKPRGRPSKRTDSVSSDGSKDLDVSKYRELRDKNNEASRKSRLKRKMKEQEYEKEANELHMKNIRLKAQVEELEKMVSTFRNNLFKILVNK